MRWGIMVMQLKTSAVNRGILINDLRRFSWISAVYLLGLLAAVPLRLYMLYSRDEQVTLNGVSTYLRVLDYSGSLQFALLAVVPVLTGLLLFRYLQSGQASDMEHALPIKRATLLNTHVLAGGMILIIPLAITALAAWITVSVLNIHQVPAAAIFTWLGQGLLFTGLFFMTTVAVGMFTGMTSLQGFLTYIFLILPTGLYWLLINNVHMHLYGFPFDYYYADRGTSFSPLLKMEQAFSEPLTLGLVLLYLFLILFLYCAARYMYRQRHLERGGSAVTFDILAQLLKYGVVFCSMLLAGGYFFRSQGSMAWAYFGYFTGSLLAYLLMEILLEKSLYIFQPRRFKGLGAYALAVVLLLAAVNGDVLGYEKRLPPGSEVESIYLSRSFYHWQVNALPHAPTRPVVYDPGSVYPYYSEYDEPMLPLFKEPANLAAIHELHRSIINRRDQADRPLHRYDPAREVVCLAYQLRDGSEIFRQYYINRHMYAAQLKPIYESREYKRLNYPVLRMAPEEVRLLEIHSYDGNKRLVISRPDLISPAIQALQQDVAEQSYEDMVSGRSPWATVRAYLDPPQSFSLSWRKSYRHFERYLQETDQYHQARLLPGEDIRLALVQRRTDAEPPAFPSGYPDLEELARQPGVITVKDPQELEQCLRSYSGSREDGYAYYIVFLLDDHRPIEGSFTEADAPAFIKERFRS